MNMRNICPLGVGEIKYHVPTQQTLSYSCTNYTQLFVKVEG